MDGETAVAASESEQAPGAAAGAVESNPADAPLTVADIERWERGQRAEMEAVEKANADRARAKSGMDSVSAQFAALEMNTVETGARAAGLSVDRYRRINNELNRVLAARIMGAATQKMYAEADTSDMPAQMRASIREARAQADSAWGDPFKDLPPGVADVLKRRAAELDTVRLRLAVGRLGAPAKASP